jgi:hypothetical protein
MEIPAPPRWVVFRPHEVRRSPRDRPAYGPPLGGAKTPRRGSKVHLDARRGGRETRGVLDQRGRMARLTDLYAEWPQDDAKRDQRRVEHAR